MPAPQSPNPSSLLAWLTVFVFLLAGAPAPRQPAGVPDSKQRMAASQELAGDFSSLDLADPQGAPQFRLLKVRNMTEAPASWRFAAPEFPLPRQLMARRAAPATAGRLSLVGMIELRL